MSTAQASFNVTNFETVIIHRIATRAVTLLNGMGAELNLLDLSMDITACHANGCPLDLAKLEAADDFNLAHDIHGIYRHINRRTGKIEHHFSPRCSLKI